tara:strand:- start:6387 stop:7151 length:765 start_codon:yes stop_codon:yes gene_type:complete
MIKLTSILNEYISAGQLNQVEKHLDKIWAKVGIDVEFTRHFHDRVNDARNKKPISSAEVIKIFRQVYKKFGKHIASLPDGVNVLFKDMQTDINVPVVLRYDNKNKEIDMISKTVMRKKNFKSSTKKYSVENKLNERVDYLDIATQLVKAYNLKSRVRFTSGSTLAEYVPETDTIYLRKSYPNMKEFIITVLHEIKHALDAKQLGTRKFMKKYTQAGTMAQYKGLDPHDDNKWEERAERWARNEFKRVKNKLNFQ